MATSLMPANLSQLLGVPVLPMVASPGQGVPELRAEICRAVANAAPRIKPRLFCQLPGVFRTKPTVPRRLAGTNFHERRLQAAAEALLILSNEKALASSAQHYPPDDPGRRGRGAGSGSKRPAMDWRGAAIEGALRAQSRKSSRRSPRELAPPGETFSDRLDRVLTHKVWGTLIFHGDHGADVPEHLHLRAIADGRAADGRGLARRPGRRPDPARAICNSLLVDGVIAGVGAVVVFLPQILLLFLFIGFLEDTGYMARAAFLMDRLMSKVGLHGKSFIPMLSSFACAIPGIMATRTIESPKDRLVTILVRR